MKHLSPPTTCREIAHGRPAWLRAALLVGLVLSVGVDVALGGRERAIGQPAPQPVPAQAPQTAPQPLPTDAAGQVPPVQFEVGVELVTVDVSVVDALGNPVRGLTIDDFELEVDGAPRAIASAQFVEQSARSGPETTAQFSTNEGAAGGRLVMIIVDQGNIRTGASTAFVRAAERLLDDIGPGDRVGLAIIPGGRVIDFTPHIASVRAGLKRAVGSLPPYESRRSSYNMSISEALAFDRGEQIVKDEVAARECPSTIPGLAPPGGEDPVQRCLTELAIEAQNRVLFTRGQTANSLTSLRQLLVGLTSVKGAKTLILLTEGLILERPASDVTWVADLSAAARASIYAVVLDDAYSDMDTSNRRISPSTTEDRRLRMQGVDTLVGLSRGNAQYVSGGSTAAFERLSRELTGYYLLGFEPEPEERDGKSHDIRVRVRRRGVELRARRSFTVDPSVNARRADEEMLAETLRDPLLATDVRLRVATYSFPDPSTRKVRLLMSTGLGLPTDDAPVAGVGFKLTDEDGKVVAAAFDKVATRTDGDHRWNGTVVVDPGTFMLKVAAIDVDGRRGSVEHRLTAQLATAGPLTFGDLMLGEEWDAAADAVRPEIEPRVAGASVSGYLEVYSTDTAVLEDVTAKLEIAADANAPALVNGSLPLVSTKYAQRRIGQAEVGLTDLPSGDYVARAVVSVRGRPVGRVLRAFTFAPSAETRALGTAGAASLSWLRVTFDRQRVLAGNVLTRMLGPVAMSNPSGAVASALEAAQRGELSTLPELLGSVRDETAASSLLRGLGLYARGDVEPAALQFRQALRADSELTSAAFYLGACYAAGGRDREAVGAWQTTLASDELDPLVFALTSEAYLRLRDWQAAVDVAEEAAVEWPADPEVQRHLIRAQALGGKRKEALDHIDAYLGEHPADHDVALLAMKLLYDAAADGRPVGDATADRARFDRYLKTYRTANGPEQALAERWQQTLTAR